MRSKAVMMIAALAIVAIISGVAGCTGTTKAPADTNMEGIDSELAKGPVFVEFGAPWCSWCQLEKPVVENLSNDYAGMAFIAIDTDSSNGSALAVDFYVDGIPQMNIIVKKNPDGSYLYVGPDGKTTSDRYKSRLVGYQESGQLKPLIEAALAAR